VRDLKRDYLRRPTDDDDVSPTVKVKGKAISSGAPCAGYQRGTCTYASDHLGPSGANAKHVCKYCHKFRPDVPLQHTPKDCPYADKATRDAYVAARA